ncbi:hypothetical protein QJQ45_018090, partial [Haematococcus lacustris]
MPVMGRLSYRQLSMFDAIQKSQASHLKLRERVLMGREGLVRRGQRALYPHRAVRLRTSSIVASAAAAAAAAAHAPLTSAHPGQNQLQRWLSWWVLKSPDAKDAPVGRTRVLPLIRKLISLIAADRLLLAAAFCFMVAAAAAELAVPHFCTSCIFAAAAPGATAASFQPTLNLLTSIVLVYGTTSALRGYCFSILNNRMTKRLRSQLFAALVRRETGFFDATETGTLTSRLQADCQAMTKCVATNLNIAMRNMMQ